MDRYIKLGVNIDHVATLRNARGGNYPDVITAAKIAEQSGADSITVHLREDRRHINENDLENLLNNINVPLNLEIAAKEETIEINQLPPTMKALADRACDCMQEEEIKTDTEDALSDLIMSCLEGEVELMTEYLESKNMARSFIARPKNIWSNAISISRSLTLMPMNKTVRRPTVSPK